MFLGLRAGVLILLATFVAGPSAAQVARATAAAQDVLRAYFTAINDHDCEQVLRLRPGYATDKCEAIDHVTIERLAFKGAAGGWQVFRVQGRIDRRDRDPQGFAYDYPLQTRDGDWVIDHAGVSKAFDLDAHRILADVPAAVAVSPELRPAGSAPPPAPDARTEGPDLTEPKLQIAAGSDSTAEARDVIDRFYRAVREHRCDDALQLRPEYSVARCESVTKVVGPEIVSLNPYEGLELFHFTVKLIRGEEIEDFEGFAAVKQRFPDWVIISDLVLNDVPLDEYKAKVADHVEKTRARQAPVASYAPETELTWWHSSPPPARLGSEALLQACWPAAELVHRPGEEHSYTSGEGVFLGPPLRLAPKTGIAALPNRYRRSIRSVDTGGARYIALTFDVCEQNNDHAGYDGEIVDYLREQDVRATFFLGGKWMATHPDRAMQLIADPSFETGNHAWTHGNMRLLDRNDPREAENQILFTQAQYELMRERLLNLDGARGLPRTERDAIPEQLTTFRYPYGTCSPESLEMVNDLGLPAVQWSIVSGDPDRSQTARDIAQRILRQAHPGAIVVMHANGRGWNTADALPILVPALREMGYEFVTVSELLGLGVPVTAEDCYENRPGDNARYDRIFGRGTGD